MAVARVPYNDVSINAVLSACKSGASLGLSVAGWMHAWSVAVVVAVVVGSLRMHAHLDGQGLFRVGFLGFRAFCPSRTGCEPMSAQGSRRCISDL